MHFSHLEFVVLLLRLYIMHVIVTNDIAVLTVVSGVLDKTNLGTCVAFSVQNCMRLDFKS